MCQSWKIAIQMSQTMFLIITELSTRTIVATYMNVNVPYPFPGPYIFNDARYEYWYEPPCNCMDCYLSRSSHDDYMYDDGDDEDDMDYTPKVVDIEEDMINEPFDEYMDDYDNKIMIRHRKTVSKKRCSLRSEVLRKSDKKLLSR